MPISLHVCPRIPRDNPEYDEIHFAKQRQAENISQRKKVIAAFLSEAAAKNENLHVLGMSATPVINNLFEGKTLIELVTGVYHDDLGVKPSIGNCVSLYQKFVSHGLRWVPSYQYSLNMYTEPVDCSHFLDEIRASLAVSNLSQNY